MINDLEIKLTKESIRYYETKLEQMKSKLARLQHKDLTPVRTKDVVKWLDKQLDMFK